MPKTPAEIKAILQEPKMREEIAKAVAVEGRIRLHSEASLSQYDCSPAVTEFLQFVKDLLQNYDRHRVFLSMFRYPVDTVTLTSEVYDALEKIFDGRDPVYRDEFTTPAAKADWQEYRDSVLKMDWFWRNEAFCELKENYKSFLVVDLPETQTTPLPTPYPYFLEMSSVIDYEVIEDFGGDEDTVAWILFRLDDNRLAYFDDKAYQVFETKKGSNEIQKELVNVPHNLGYCPATKFWTEEHPLGKWLSKLDKLLFFLVSKDEMDLGNSYPVWWMYETDCDFENPATLDYCDGGFLRSTNGNYLMSRQIGAASAGLHACPKCKGKFRGAGTVLKLPVPKNDTEKPLGTPAGIITTPVENLDFHVKELERRSWEIYEGVTGGGAEPSNDQAQNEKQVMSSFEGRSDVLKKFKKHFERAQRWTESTICKLRYDTKFKGISVDYGQTFYLATAEMLLQEYQDAVKANTPDDILDEMLADYHQTKYRNNPDMRERERMLSALDPFRHRTLAQVKELFDKQYIEFADYYLKFNFSSLIARFERENISVTQFGEALEFSARIEAISETLRSYGKDIEAATKTGREQQQAINGGGNANAATNFATAN